MFEVKEVKADMIYDLRHKILRPHQKLEDCMYDTDNEKYSFHIGAFLQNKLISIASFCVEKNNAFLHDKQYRLRAMATDEYFRNLGAGRAVVFYGEKIIKDKGYDFLWCKARTSVQSYYVKLGFKLYGDVFDYPPIGPHIIMYTIL